MIKIHISKGDISLVPAQPKLSMEGYNFLLRLRPTISDDNSESDKEMGTKYTNIFIPLSSDNLTKFNRYLDSISDNRKFKDLDLLINQNNKEEFLISPLSKDSLYNINKGLHLNKENPQENPEVQEASIETLSL